LDRTDFRNGPSRPDVATYAGRLSRSGDMFSEQRAAYHYNLKVNQSWYAQQRDGDARSERRQFAPEKTEPEKQRETRRADLRPAPARAPEKAAPERQQARIELRHGFNAGVPVSEPRHQVRRSYEQAPQRNDSEARSQMREAARETLRPHGPERPEAQELNRAPERPRGLER
jgi:hypothetical protein